MSQSPHQPSPQPSTNQPPMQQMQQMPHHMQKPMQQGNQPMNQQEMYPPQQGQGYPPQQLYHQGSAGSQQMMYGGQQNPQSFNMVPPHQMHHMPQQGHNPSQRSAPQMQQPHEMQNQGYGMPSNPDYGFQHNGISHEEQQQYPQPPGMGDMSGAPPFGRDVSQNNGMSEDLLWLQSSEDIDAVLKDDLTGPSAEFQSYNANAGFW
mmetsp:Transcript_39920/g.62265  ORF Transcript_39920/g.62265 Transcript_39920/m.62265 type:complete len:205 (-) Transcript_39920:498-1112(-)